MGTDTLHYFIVILHIFRKYSALVFAQMGFETADITSILFFFFLHLRAAEGWVNGV